MKSSNTRLTSLTAVLSAQASNTVTANLRVKPYDHIMFQLGTVIATDGTIKVRSSVDKDADLTAAKSVSNMWGYKYIWNLDTGLGSQGSTGLTPGASLVNEYKVNVDGAYIMAFEITSQTAGAYTVNVYGVNKYGS